MTTSDKRKLILDGAEKIFAAKGFAGSKVEEIAEQAGVAKGTIYLYFPSKEEVFISLIEERVNELISLVQERIKGLDCAIKLYVYKLKPKLSFIRNMLVYWMWLFNMHQDSVINCNKD